ncbi:zinc finger protein 22-like [Pempheris klunzingeri]|uniref:zinc finger protein 22-like n=1 Tax=Pempheris klunzingeri TaxID=3127111 RepID=UPI00397EA117
MLAVDCLREFVSERLSAAAQEIFDVFKKTIAEYEEEIDRQRRLLDVVWKPQVKLRRLGERAELPQQYVYKEEEALTDLQLCVQERSSSLDHEDPEVPQVKAEEEQLCTGQEGEQLAVKQEADAFILTPAYEEAAPQSDQQLLCSNFHTPESQNQKGNKRRDSGAKTRRHKSKRRFNNSTLSEARRGSLTGKKCHKCDTCGKGFRYKSKLKTHQIVHTGEKAHSCSTCGKRFSHTSSLIAHVRIHTGEKPFTCKICGKDFRIGCDLKFHMRIHTGEKPHSCKICGKDFKFGCGLKNHVRIHTGEKPYVCKTCGKRFCVISALRRHMGIHKEEKQ